MGKEEIGNIIGQLEYTLEEIRYDIMRRDLQSLEDNLGLLFDEDAEFNFDCSEYYEEISECIRILKIHDSQLIYIPQKPEIYVPELIITVNENLIRLAKNPNLLFQITPRQFEEIIAEIFYKKGFEVELTKTTCDGGMDIVAISNHMDIRVKYFIECKRYSRQNKISVGLVQRLFGVKIAEQANKAILATTSSLTKQARIFGNNHIWDLELKDYDDIVKWIKGY